MVAGGDAAAPALAPLNSASSQTRRSDTAMSARRSEAAPPTGVAWPAIAHFTRAAGEARAIDNLIAILRAGVIRGSIRMVRGGRPVVCLCDAPVGELRHILARVNRRRYEPFGVAVEKRYAFRMGARPAIYMPWNEAERSLDSAAWWRVVAFDLASDPPVDWSFEREWRVAGDLPLEPAATVALVATWRDADEIYDAFDGRPPCAGVMPIAEMIGSA
jgi:hypothetical protein